MRRGRVVGAIAAALVVGACGSDGKTSPPAASGSGTTANDPEALWMEDAEVRVTEDVCAGTSTVELVNAAAGRQAVLDVETSAPDASCRS